MERGKYDAMEVGEATVSNGRGRVLYSVSMVGEER